MPHRIVPVVLAISLLLAATGSIAVAQSSSVVVTATVPSLSIDGVGHAPAVLEPCSGPVTVSFTLARPAPELVVITDPLGAIQYLVTVPQDTAGLHSLTWDGRDTLGRLVPPSWYTCTLTASLPGMSAQAIDTIPVSHGCPLTMQEAGVTPRTLTPPATVTFSARASRAAYVDAVIRSADGRIVRTSGAVLWPRGTVSYVWDGKDARGSRVPDGTYRCTLTGRDSGGNVASVTQKVRVTSRK